MYYYLYQIKNKVNDKIYIGIHKTSNLDDGYMGSGTYLKKAKLKYGIENFEKTILKFFDNYEELLLAESEIVNESFISREDVYNLIKGGLNMGFEEINRIGLNLYGKNGTLGFGGENLIDGAELKRRLQASGKWEEHKDRMSRILLDLYESGFQNPFLGRRHSEETKSMIGSKNSITQSGEKNSQFGSMWITNGTENKKIKKESPILQGWRRGRV